MGEIKDNDAYEEELLDYEEEDEKAPDSVSAKAADSAKKLVFLLYICIYSFLDKFFNIICFFLV